MHVVVNGFFQTAAQGVMVGACRVDESNVVLSKTHLRQGHHLHTVVSGGLAYGRMHRAGKAVEEAALNASVLKQLAHILQGVHSVLQGLGWEAIHQIRMHQDARL